MNTGIKPRILGIITARGGSKGLPGKNIIPVLGKPLIAYTIDAALKTNYISKTVVSSDNAEILRISEKFGAFSLQRPDEFAQDTSSSEDAVYHVLNTLEANEEEFDIFVLLQPTSPLRDAEDVDNAISLMLSKSASAVISVTNIGVKPFKSYYLNKQGFVQGVHNNETHNMRRQDLPDAYLANGAIYATYVDEFLISKSLIPVRTIPYIMDSVKSVDVDTIEDIYEVERIIREKMLLTIK